MLPELDTTIQSIPAHELLAEGAVSRLVVLAAAALVLLLLTLLLLLLLWLLYVVEDTDTVSVASPYVMDGSTVGVPVAISRAVSEVCVGRTLVLAGADAVLVTRDMVVGLDATGLLFWAARGTEVYAAAVLEVADLDGE